MISIIIPTYNRAHVLPRAIESVQKQEFKDWQLIIVDDGSTDQTEELMQQFLQDDRIKYVKKENSGAAHSRNVGVDHASFDWITFLDSDDEAKTDWLKVAFTFINKPKVALFSCAVEVVGQDGSLIKNSYPTINNKLFPNVTYKLTNGGSFFVLKHLFKLIEGYDVAFKANQHTELAYRLLPVILNKKLEILFTNEILVRINIHNGERIRNNYRSVYEGTKKMIEKHISLLCRDNKLISDYFAVLSNAAFRIKKDKREIISYQLQSLKYSPLNIKRYLQLIKYIF